MAQACGWRFFDQHDLEIKERMSGGLLHRIARIEPPGYSLPRIRVACDVNNRLCGPAGAAQVYGPQKGATPEQVQMLDNGLAHLALIADQRAANSEGAGAAGGAGYGLMTFFNATLERGIDLVLDALHFREHCSDADLVITGEGRLDSQSLRGKACMGVASAAAEHCVPTIAIVGSTGPGAEDCINPDRGGFLRAYFALEDRFGRERALRETSRLITELTEDVLRNLDILPT
jgi:glycerate kinase